MLKADSSSLDKLGTQSDNRGCLPSEAMIIAKEGHSGGGQMSFRAVQDASPTRSPTELSEGEWGS